MNAYDNMAVVPKHSQNITREKLKKFLPKGSSTQVTDEVLAMIHSMEDDTGLPQEVLEEDVMSYMHLVGKIGGVGIGELVNAIKYCNLKRNRSNKEAWAIVFPKKYDELTEAGKPVDNFVSMYNGSKLVVAIDKEMIIPVYVQYSAYRHAAINKQYQLMNGDDGHGGNVSPMVMHLASKTLIETLKLPEDNSIELKIGASDAVLEAQRELASSIESLVAQQAKAFASGYSASDVQKIHKAVIVDASKRDAIDADIDEDE